MLLYGGAGRPRLFYLGVLYVGFVWAWIFHRSCVFYVVVDRVCMLDGFWICDGDLILGMCCIVHLKFLKILNQYFNIVETT